MDAQFEKQLIEYVRPMYLKGRKGDWEHILNMTNLCKILLEHEKGDAGIVLPAAYLHDIGWTALDFNDFNAAMPNMKSNAASAVQHMKQGAVIAGHVLSDLGYEPARIKTIQNIIRVHDLPQKIFKMNNINATLVMEADRLDRYGKNGITRLKTMFGEDNLKGDYWEQIKQMQIDGLKNWFRTKTAIALSKQFAQEMGLFDDHGNFKGRITRSDLDEALY